MRTIIRYLSIYLCHLATCPLGEPFSPDSCLSSSWGVREAVSPEERHRVVIAYTQQSPSDSSRKTVTEAGPATAERIVSILERPRGLLTVEPSTPSLVFTFKSNGMLWLESLLGSVKTLYH